MARLIVLILMALLPLRGWSAAAMSINMALNETLSQVSVEHSPHAAMPDDCPMLKQLSINQTNPTSPENQQPSGETHHECQSCQLCMSLLTQDVRALIGTEPAPVSLAITPADRYASADLPQAAKPPIS